MAAPLVFRLKSFIILIAAFWCVLYPPAPEACLAEGVREIRVLILSDAGSFGLEVKGPYRIINSADGRILSSGRDLNAAVSAYKQGVIVGAKSFNADKVLVCVDESGEVVLNGRRFRGGLEFIKEKDNKFSLVNRIGLEDYLKGILYHEASHYWPMEALKAQAIVCRSYALYQMELNKAKDYDATSDIYSQVYGGRSSERYRTNTAVEKTTRQVLVYRGKVLPAFFHATCGGRTEDAFLLWNIDLPPLKGVTCGFCGDSPHYNWRFTLREKEFRDKLNKSGYGINQIKDITVTGRDNSGRVLSLEVAGPAGPVRIPAGKLRIILGPNLIRSTNFTAGVAGGEIIFEGLGWGHGVGMCQWGAYFMAKEGRNYKEILKRYYPGARIETLRF